MSKVFDPRLQTCMLDEDKIVHFVKHTFMPDVLALPGKPTMRYLQYRVQ